MSGSGAPDLVHGVGHADDILSSITSVFIVLDNDERVLQWNEAAERVLEVPAADALCRHWRELPLRLETAAFEKLLSACRATPNSTVQQEVRVYSSDGRTGAFAFIASPLRRSTPVARLGNLLMEKGGVSAEVVARGLERQLRGDARPLGEILVEAAGVARDQVESALQEQHRLQSEKGEGVILIGVDQTERRAREAQMAHNQKLEAIGQLAAGIAHEINTPTQFIGDNLRFLKESYGDLLRLITACRALSGRLSGGEDVGELNGEVQKIIQDIDLDYLMEEIPLAIGQSQEGNVRVAGIVRAMKEFSHPGSDSFTTVDINHAIESTLVVSRNEYKYVADVETELDPRLPSVPCIPGELNQVLLNLIINAAHAIEEKQGGGGARGKITVRTRAAQDCVEIEVEDTGNGIPEKVRGRIYDPFFTTKQVGKGTGQGLAISHTVVVEKHKGSITFTSEVGKGTCFLIQLPLIQEIDEHEANA